MSRTARFTQLTPHAPEMTARPGIELYSISGTTVNVSGQTAVRDGSNIANGIVGDGIDLATARECAWQCAQNVIAVLEGLPGGLDSVAAVRRITVYVASTPDFTDHHLVADVATACFHEVFGEAGKHARAAIGVAALPTGSPVEVDAIVELHP